MLHYAKIPQFQVKCLPKNNILIKKIQHRGASGLDSIWLDWMGISEWYEVESTLGSPSKKNTGLFEFFPSDGPSRPLFRRPPSKKEIG